MYLTICAISLKYIVLGMRKIGGYEEIAPMIKKLCEFVDGKNIEMIGPPIFVCHEMTVKEVIKAFEQKMLMLK